LPLTRLLPAEYRDAFASLEEKERLKAEKAARDAEARERRAKHRPKERQRETLHMSEEKRHQVEGLLRGISGDGDGARDDDGGETTALDDDAATALTAALATLGFTTSDATAAVQVVRSGTRRDAKDAALDWLVLNVPESRLPRTFAPDAKSDGVVLMDTAAAFAPAGSKAGSDGGGFGGSKPKPKRPERRAAEARPSDADAAWLWDRGYTAAEASDALAAADGGGRDRALEALFRETLVRATDGRDWSAWPFTGGGGGERGGGGGGGGDDDDDGGDDPWEDELVAVEAIFGDDVVSRPSRDVVIVTVDVDDGRGGKGKVALEVRRPSGGGYPTEEPPTISLAAASGDGATSRGALRAATASLAAAAAAAAEDGIPCVHSLAELLPGALAERVDAPAPGEGAGEEEEEEEEETDAVKEEKEEIVVGAAKASSSSIPAPRAGVAVVAAPPRASSTPTKSAPKVGTRGTDRDRNRPRGRDAALSPSEAAAESARLKAAQESYFSGGGGSGAASKMVATRANLPASASREEVVRAVDGSPVVVLSGETGCGKSTQVPQFILESAIDKRAGGSCNIVCTQPRRISAIGLAERVASERVENCGDVVGCVLYTGPHTTASAW